MVMGRQSRPPLSLSASGPEFRALIGMTGRLWVIRDRGGPAASQTTSVIAPKAEVHSGRWRRLGGPCGLMALTET